MTHYENLLSFWKSLSAVKRKKVELITEYERKREIALLDFGGGRGGGFHC